jgi:hypothetical protein
MGKPYGWMDVMDQGVKNGMDDRVREGGEMARYGIPSPRRIRLSRLVDEAGGVIPLASRAGIFLPFLLEVVQGGAARRVSWCLARRLEVAMERPRGWMDGTQP